jgi:hypothetical protein
MSAEPDEFWPGTTVKKSLHTGFTVGFGDKPHGYVPGSASTQGKGAIRGTAGLRQHRAFGSINGTINFKKTPA